MSLRNEQCNKVCRILDDVLANRPTERDSLITAVRKAFGALETEPQWIPCSERLPEEEKEVFVYLFGDIPYIAWVDKNGVWNTEDFEVDDDNRPVAWMSLPKPYKGES